MRSGVLLLSLSLLAAPAMAQNDSAYHAMQHRGRNAMGVDQYTSVHQFEALPNGGRVELQRNVDDTAGVSRIRAHLKEIAAAFQAGDFRSPRMVHDTVVPGVAVMAARREHIRYQFRELPRGGEVRIITTDPQAVEAVHQFLAFQRREHRVEEHRHQ